MEDEVVRSCSTHRKMIIRIWIEFMRITTCGVYETGNEISAFMKGTKSVGQLNNYQFLNKYSAHVITTV
jgi:hypothetical protein